MSDPELSASQARSGDGVPIGPASDLESAPVSSGRVTSMAVAATGPTEARSKRIKETAKDTLDKGVTRIGSGLETIGEGVTRIGERSKKVPLVGSGVTKIGEGITELGESLTDLPRVARTRRGRLLLRSLVVGFILVFAWIAVIVALQVRGNDAPDFRPDAERILRDLSKGSASIGEVYEKASPRFHEVVRKERFIDDMMDLNATVGKFKEVTSINESLVTRGPTGKIGRISLSAEYERGKTRAAISLHWDEGEWKLLGVGVEVPPEVPITQAQREERVQACKDPMDPKRCDVYIAANAILEKLRDGQAEQVWDQATRLFQKQEEKARFVQIQREHASVLGEYRRIIAVTEAKVIGGTYGIYDVLVEYSKANVRAIFGFDRGSKADPWELRSLKVVLPMPRLDDVEASETVGPPLVPSLGSGSAGSAIGSSQPTGSASGGSGSGKPTRTTRATIKSGGKAGGGTGSGSATKTPATSGSNAGAGSGSSAAGSAGSASGPTFTGSDSPGATQHAGSGAGSGAK